MTRFLADGDVEIVPADGVGEAGRRLSGPAEFDLVFVDSELRDGSWRDLLQLVLARRTHCEVVVCARCGDERLWAEVIQCGAFDLVPEPMERQEVVRIMRSALDSHYLERFSRASEAQAV
jgi:DNA-binding NtrC family response regulator